MKDKNSNIFIGERVRLRKLTLSDSLMLYKILSDPETMRYYPKPYKLSETKAWIEEVL